MVLEWDRDSRGSASFCVEINNFFNKTGTRKRLYRFAIVMSAASLISFLQKWRDKSVWSTTYIATPMRKKVYCKSSRDIHRALSKHVFEFIDLFSTEFSFEYNREYAISFIEIILYITAKTALYLRAIATA